MQEKAKVPKVSFIRKLADGYMSLSGREKFLFYICCFVLLALGIYIFIGIRPIVNTEFFVPSLLVQEIKRSGNLFPPEWTNHTSSEISAFGLHSIVLLLSYVMEDQMIMICIAGAIYITLAVATVIYCSRKVSFNRCWLVAVPLLFCAVSDNYDLIMFRQFAYIPAFLYMFLGITLFIDSLDDNYTIRSKIKFAFACLVIAATGLNGMRYIQSIGLPIFGALIISYIIMNYKEKKGLVETIESSQFKKLFIQLLCVGIAMVVGFVGYKTILNSQYIRTNNSAKLTNDFVATFERFVECLYILVGVDGTPDLFSLSGIVSAVKAVCGVMLMIVFPVLQVRNYKNENPHMKFFIVFAVLHILEILFLSLFCDYLFFANSAARYLLSVQFLLYYLSAHYIYNKYIKEKGCIQNILSIFSICALVVPCSIPKATSFVGNAQKLEERTAIVDFLLDNDLEYGYATYWNSFLYSGYSNLEVQLTTVKLDPLRPNYNLNSRYYYTEEAYQGETFLMLTDSENETFLESEAYINLGTPSEVLENSGFTIYVYDYNIANNKFEGISVK